MPTAVKERILNLITKDHQKYFEITQFFLDPSISKSSKELKSFNFLEREIEQLDNEFLEIPSELDKLEEWLDRQNKLQCTHYKGYIERRMAGGNREFFNSTSKAYEFLYKVAPTKLVDGAWLFSFTQYWNDPAFKDFIQIYLEELGLGLEQSNHVRVFDNLLFSLGLHEFSLNLDDEYYHQAAIQLALAYAPSEFIPEIAGFNLGYEQLPLHLLITNYELKELGIDSKYFNLHITIDNFDSGHAQVATNAVKKLSSRFKDKINFMHKLRNGFLLNNRGKSSVQIIKSLSTEHVVMEIFRKKAVVGKHMHANNCLFNKRPINEWLSEDELVEEFIFELIRVGWIKLNEDPENSRFWKLIDHEDGKMFGVFSAAEKTFIYDWISGSNFNGHKSSVNSELIDNYMGINKFSYIIDNELHELQKQVQDSSNIAYKIGKLIPYLAPHSHHEEIGLWSTQRITEYLFPYLTVRK